MNSLKKVFIDNLIKSKNIIRKDYKSQAIINIIREFKLNIECKWIDEKTFFEYEKKVIKNLNQELNDEEVYNMFYKINDNIDIKFDDKFEITIFEEKQSINDEFMDDINMDINLEDSNPDSDYIIVDNKDYNLNTNYEEVLKNLDYINIYKDNLNLENRNNSEAKDNFLNNFFNTKLEKENVIIVALIRLKLLRKL